MQDVNVLLSVVICSIPERIHSLSVMLTELQRQISNHPVQILVLTDNKHMTIGKKRQLLNVMAFGKYIVHIDDDDRIEPDFIHELMNIINMGKEVDVICFHVNVNIDNEPTKLCIYHKDCVYQNCLQVYFRTPNPRCCFLRYLAVMIPFKNISFAEDDDWAYRMKHHIKQQVSINKILYHYDYVSKDESWYGGGIQPDRTLIPRILYHPSSL